MSEVDALERLLDYLQKPGAAETLEKLTRLLENLDRSGLLDLLLALTEPEVVERLENLLVTPGLLRALDRLDKLTELAGRAAMALDEPPEPVSLTQALHSLKDPDIARGLGLLLQILKALGSANL